ncbi:MAG: hypothetical protein ACRD25_07835 [Terracidiphilus sp.]
MRAALEALNRLLADRVIENYAIGGAIAASFYLPAMQTEDIDVGMVEREYIRFGEWPLQILTDATPLISGAIREAIEVDYEGIPTRVFRPEHLCAIALQTGRSKDYARVMLFLEQNEVDRQKLSDLASTYGLTDRLLRVVGSLEPGKADTPQ